MGVPSSVSGALRTTTGSAVGAPHHHFECRGGHPPEQLGHRGDVARIGHTAAVYGRCDGVESAVVVGVLLGEELDDELVVGAGAVGAGTITNAFSPGFTRP